MITTLGSYLKSAGIKHNQLAKMLGVTPNAVTNWVKGRRRPTVDKAIQISKILNVAIDALFLSKNVTNSYMGSKNTSKSKRALK